MNHRHRWGKRWKRQPRRISLDMATYLHTIGLHLTPWQLDLVEAMRDGHHQVLIQRPRQGNHMYVRGGKIW